MDELKTKEEGKALRTFEAYVHIMVAKGKLTEENYTGKICNYMDQVLGDYVQKNWINDDGKEGENFILANTVFVDLTEELKKQDNAQANAANAKTKTKPSTLKKAASIKSESSTQGTKKKKKKKKGSRKKKNA
jgi:chromatin remodeling complex protein RSC6